MMKKLLAFHPMLLAAFPTIFLYSHNIAEYPLSVVWVPLIASFALGLFTWLVFGLVSRNINKGALIASLFLLLFFSYGHLNDILWYFFAVQPFTFKQGAGTVLKPLFGLLFLGGTVWIIRTRRSLTTVTRWANIVAIILVIVPLLTLGLSALTGGSVITEDHQTAPERATTVTTELLTELPDIYYIILDGFGREDVLADLYSYPHSALYEYLRGRGFFVGDKSGSNYCQTMLSLSSSLNYKYLDPVEDGYDPDSRDRRPLNRLVLNSRIVAFLREQGYTFVAFATGSAPTEIRNADVFLEPASKVWFLDEFQSGLLNTTPLPQLIPKLDHIPFFKKGLSHPQANARRELILRTFDQLAEMPQRVSPKFVFAHLVTPHPPFLFGPDGEPRDPPGIFSLADGNALVGRLITSREGYIMLYRDQLRFIEKKIIAAVEMIITHSTRPPIIILQADHGPAAYLSWDSSEETDMRERLAILNAYYLPHGGDTLLYESITPVNTFRVILNHYFNQNLQLLPDESYYSLWKKPYAFMPVSRTVTGDTGAPALDF